MLMMSKLYCHALREKWGHNGQELQHIYIHELEQGDTQETMVIDLSDGHAVKGAVKTPPHKGQGH